MRFIYGKGPVGDIDLHSDEGICLGWINDRGFAIVAAAPNNPEDYDRRYFDNTEEAKAWLIYACTFYELTGEMPDEELWVWNGMTQEIAKI